MATLVSGHGEDPTTTLYSESFGEAGLSFATICGGLAGAIGGAALGAELGSVFPVVCGTLGTMLVGGLACGAWCLVTRVWTTLFARK